MPRWGFFALLCLSALGFAQEPPRFEVASIRPSNPDESNLPSGCQTGNGLMRCQNVTLKRCIVGAYEILAEQIFGGPDWIDSDRFDITARADRPVGDKGLDQMLQMLLAERFHLKLHHETRAGETMALEVARGGPKLEPAADAKHSYDNAHDHLDATVTMAQLAEILTRDLRLPVKDRTGLSGAFKFTLHWNPDFPAPLSRDDAAEALRLEVSRAMVQQLGLRLRRKRMRIDVLVVASADKPSPN